MEENASRDDQAARGGLGKRHLVFAIICLINFTIWLDEGVFAALTPYWAKELNLTPAQIGTGSAAYLLGYFPVLFLAGILSDRFGARRMLFICVIGCSILSAAMLWVHDYWTLFIRNILFGIFFGFLWAPCNKLLTSWMPAVEKNALCRHLVFELHGVIRRCGTACVNDGRKSNLARRVSAGDRAGYSRNLAVVVLYHGKTGGNEDNLSG
ncbi:MFS transporter [Ochrobactrum pecoris]|nr:MFS transporter [Brucella pecoris]